jgi:DNA (cytosine-5)-methyltransferase 1
MRFLDLFSGIGGFALGLEKAGMTVAAFCEIESFCQAVLRKHWPDVPIFGDIRKLTKEKLIEAGVIGNGRTVDLICGGLPCQPFSCAGKRRGTADSRYLWPEMFRIIKAVRPRWVLGENVAGIVNLALDTVLSDLESEGYETATFIIPACAVNAPHRRDRVWIVAHSAGVECQSGAEKQGVLRRVPANGKKCSNVGRSGEAQSGEDVAYPAGKRLEGKVDQTRQVARCDKRQIESRLGGISNGLAYWVDLYNWPAPLGCEQYDWEPPRTTIDKVPYRRQRLQALGNAVVPLIPYVIGTAIQEIEKCCRRDARCG